MVGEWTDGLGRVFEALEGARGVTWRRTERLDARGLDRSTDPSTTTRDGLRSACTSRSASRTPHVRARAVRAAPPLLSTAPW